MTAIVTDLLDYSTSHLGGGIPVTFDHYDASEECRAVMHEMQLFHPGRDSQPDIADGVMVHWDRARISQALSNLIGNAVQHGAVESPIWVTFSVADKDAVLLVQNEGRTISPRRLRNMFDPGKSFMIKSTSERSASQTSNLGLGLYIAHEIVLAHGGKIWVTSTEREGTTFKVQLPLQPPTARQ